MTHTHKHIATQYNNSHAHGPGKARDATQSAHSAQQFRTHTLSPQTNEPQSLRMDAHTTQREKELKRVGGHEETKHDGEKTASKRTIGAARTREIFPMTTAHGRRGCEAKCRWWRIERGGGRWCTRVSTHARYQTATATGSVNADTSRGGRRGDEDGWQQENTERERRRWHRLTGSAREWHRRCCRSFARP